MNKKLWNILLVVALVVSTGLNMIMAKNIINGYEKPYEELAKQHLLNLKIIALLESSNISEAKSLIANEIKIKGAILAICVEESCLGKTVDLLDSKESH